MRGYSVDCAQDGLTASHLISTQPYDLLILDVMLPGIDGYQICQRLRHDIQLDTPVIMLTARDSLDDRLQGFRVGSTITWSNHLPCRNWQLEAKLCCTRSTASAID